MKRQKLSFKAKKYIYTYFIKKGKAVISLDIKDNVIFYNQLDVDKITLSDAIIKFIDDRIDYISYRYEVVLNFYCPPMSTEEKNHITEMIRAHYGLEANERTIDLNINNFKSLTLFVMGIFFLGLASLSSKYGFLLKEVLSIAGWVAVWETVTSIFFDTIKIKLDRYDATKLYNAEINFITKEN